MQSIPLAVLKLPFPNDRLEVANCMQSIPLAVLKLSHLLQRVLLLRLHAIHTACGIETNKIANHTRAKWPLHAIHTACGIFLFLARFFQTRAFFMA